MAKTDTHGLKPLLRRALAGDARAWNDFFQQIRRYLHAEVHKVLGPDHQGPPEASDVAPDADAAVVGLEAAVLELPGLRRREAARPKRVAGSVPCPLFERHGE
jgi:hypothetical protein